jgi:hypothetical protein
MPSVNLAVLDALMGASKRVEGHETPPTWGRASCRVNGR